MATFPRGKGHGKTNRYDAEEADDLVCAEDRVTSRPPDHVRDREAHHCGERNARDSTQNLTDLQHGTKYPFHRPSWKDLCPLPVARARNSPALKFLDPGSGSERWAPDHLFRSLCSTNPAIHGCSHYRTPFVHPILSLASPVRQ